MAVHFQCTGCGRCCHGLRLPLSVAEAIRWLERGGSVQILCDAAPMDAAPEPMTALRHERAFPARSGALEISVDLVLAASFADACPNLLPDMRCGIYDERPATCRIYPAELNPGRLIDPAAKRCPADAWRDVLPILTDDGGTLVEPVTATTVERAREDFAADGVVKDLIAFRLGIDAVALGNEGYAVWTPPATGLLDALRAAIRADPDDDDVDRSWNFVSNRAATRDLIVSAGADIVEIDTRRDLSYLPFFENAD